MRIKYHDNMTPAEERALLDECKALDDAYSDAYAEDSMNPFYHLGLAIWLQVQWQEDLAANGGGLGDEYDTEQYRRYFWEDIGEHFDPVRDGWVGRDGRP